MREMLLFTLLLTSVCSGTSTPTREDRAAAIFIPPTREALAGGVERNSDVCGIRRRSLPDLFTRIVGGAPAEPHEFPWQVSLQWRYSWYTYHVCGAAVVDQNWVITAAHCTHQFQPKDLVVVAGDHNVKLREGTEQTRDVSQIVEHPSYSATTQENDLALIRLTSPLILDGVTISPVCLPPYKLGFSGFCLVSGWGKQAENGANADKLQKVMVPIISDQKCRQSYSNIGYAGPIVDSMICAGYSAGGRDACQGDSGGPFVCLGPDNRYHLAGVVSWGVGCARPNVPGVYTEVSHYVDWVFNVIMQRIATPERPASRLASSYHTGPQEPVEEHMDPSNDQLSEEVNNNPTQQNSVALAENHSTLSSSSLT